MDASGNKYIWIYNALADLDTPDPNADAPIVTGYGPDTFQLIPVTTDGSGYMVALYTEVPTPTRLNIVTPVAANAPPGCEPP